MPLERNDATEMVGVKRRETVTYTLTAPTHCPSAAVVYMLKRSHVCTERRIFSICSWRCTADGQSVERSKRQANSTVMNGTVASRALVPIAHCSQSRDHSVGNVESQMNPMTYST